jgi:hypothetical protein
MYQKLFKKMNTGVNKYFGFSVVCLFIVGCGSANEEVNSANKNNVDLALEIGLSPLSRINTTELIGLDSLEVRVSSDDMNSVNWEGSFSDSLVNIPSFPAGNLRTIEAYLYDSAGVLMFQGDTVMNFSGGSQLLEISVQQEFGVIKAEMALGWFSPVGSGQLSLGVGADTLIANLKIKNGVGVFELSKIPFGKSYPLSFDILDTLGVSMFSADTIVDVLRGQKENLVFKVSPKLSQMALKLKINQETQLKITLENTDALFLDPSLGGIRISELMPNPMTSGDSLEWLELVNLGGDSLNLNDCSLRKNISSTTASTRLDLTGLAIAPADILVLGRENMDLADWNYSEFTMANSSGTVLLVCDNVILDSLSWKEGESINEEILSVQSESMVLDDYNLIEGVSVWCNSKETYSIGGNDMMGSPGEFETCELY